MFAAMQSVFPERGNGPYRLFRGFSMESVTAFERSLGDPEGAQRARLAAILDGARDTAFARDNALFGHGGASPTLEAWREALPVRSYDDHAPWMQRVHAGEARVLTQAPVVSLLKTSGTTGAAKLLPVTAPYAEEVSRGQGLWRLALMRDHEAVAQGAPLTFVSPAVEGHLPSGLAYGSNTGRMHEAQPWLVRQAFPVPPWVVRLPEYELRLYCTLRFALQAKVTSLTTANPSTILLVRRKLEEWREELSADLRDGTLRHGPARVLAERQSISTRLRMALRLRRVSPPTDWRPAQLWPLAVVCCWKGGPAGFFLERLPQALGRDLPVREVGITASEGYFGIPVGDDDDGGVAWLGGHLLEFIDAAGQARFAWELEEGQEYRLVITTSGGLYRYDLNDIVRVTGFLGRAPRLRFVRKGGNVLNLTGEKLTEDQAVRAVRAALGGAEVTGFTLGYALAEVPRLVLAVEGEAPPDLAARLERALCEVNVEYADKRGSGRLGPPAALALPPGTYLRWRAARAAEGAPDGQVKDPVLALDDRAWDRVTDAAGLPRGAARGAGA